MTSFVLAQEAEPLSAGTDPVFFYASGQVGVPIGDLKKAIYNDVGNVGGGLSVGLLFNPYGTKRNTPVHIGIDFGYLTYGVDKIAPSATNPPLKTSFNVYTIGPAARILLSHRGGFTPFIDGGIGAKIFNTRTKVDKDITNIILNTNQPEVINTTNDTSLGYSVGIGFFNHKASTESMMASFTLRVMYLWGNEARYVLRDSVTVDANANVQFKTGYTRTDMILVQVGLLLFQ
jgi:hypothetical protein